MIWVSSSGLLVVFLVCWCGRCNVLVCCCHMFFVPCCLCIVWWLVDDLFYFGWFCVLVVCGIRLIVDLVPVCCWQLIVVVDFDDSCAIGELWFVWIVGSSCRCYWLFVSFRWWWLRSVLWWVGSARVFCWFECVGVWFHFLW